MDSEHSRALAAVIVGALLVLMTLIVTDPRLTDSELVVLRGTAIVLLIVLGLAGVVVVSRGR